MKLLTEIFLVLVSIFGVGTIITILAGLHLGREEKKR